MGWDGLSSEMKLNHEQREIRRKKRVLGYVERLGNVRKACRHVGVPCSDFHLWQQRYRVLGDDGMKRRSPHLCQQAVVVDSELADVLDDDYSRVEVGRAYERRVLRMILALVLGDRRLERPSGSTAS